MDNREYTEILGAEIKKIQKAGPESSKQQIADYLKGSLKTYSYEQQIAVLDDLIDRFTPGSRKNTDESAPQASLSENPLIKLLDRSGDEQPDLTTDEFNNRISTALEVIFRQLNEITTGITASFADQPTSQPTIQKAISAYLDGSSDINGLKAHLEIIKNVFALTQQAFTQALNNKIKEIINELDPDQIDEKNNSGGLNFGAFHKAKKFDMLKQKHQTLSRWFDSGLLNEALLKEFEGIYQKLYAAKREET